MKRPVRTIETNSENETLQLGEHLGRGLMPGDVVCLFGDLGAGKTRIVKGICHALGVREHTSSPTFTLVNEYQGTQTAVFHFDFYRLERLQDILNIGFEEYLDRKGVVLIEWADRAIPLLPDHRYEVHLSLGNSPTSRLIRIEQMDGVDA